MPSGSHALVTGAAAGATASSYDVDGGATTVRSPPVVLPATVGPLTFRYYFAHSSNSSARTTSGPSSRTQDGVRTLVAPGGRRANNDLPAWKTATISMTPWAGQTVRIVFAARRPRPREHGRGRRRRRADHPPVSGSRTRIVVRRPSTDSARSRRRGRPRADARSPGPARSRANRRPSRTGRRCGAAASGSMPRPVSRTSRRSQPDSDAAGDRDPPAGRRVAQRVGDEVREHLADPHRVDVDHRQVAVDGGRQLDAGGRAAASNERTTSTTSSVRVGRLAVEGERPGLGQGHRAQVVDQPAQDARLVEDRRPGAPGRAGRRRRRSPRGCPGRPSAASAARG